ncbi:pentatricopeptide repeat-containing protein At4g21065 [Dendrobium catenatum]|uniref:Pentatricopeptide repeat-containing protein n=1 Tax=Dendrobium catenatum TaxID=906689 RepID=A0A2I0X046_9ASPA|nr:pentatricopeptide repeat-containing protein At4g21065 [Dendrobium catenatum]XP_020674154.1 pentatricopeptide repeat-containing protein At4g21065 [Dendrobium catenatum]PKU81271.1 Pentatricopeptide repeat-containing protein [Dendrobium catenatum]
MIIRRRISTTLLPPLNQLLRRLHTLPTTNPIFSDYYNFSDAESFNNYHAYLSLLQSFVSRKAIGPGKQLHARLLLSNLGFDTVLATKLVNLYSVCNHLPYAHSLFDRIPKRNIFLWNILIRGYAWNGPFESAVSLYYQMLDHGILPDNFTFPFVLKACSALSDIDNGREIHKLAVLTRWELDVFVAAGLIDMYSKCSSVVDARRLFDRILNRDVVLWNSMIAAYSQNGHPSEALSLFRKMALEGFKPSVATLVTVISASADAAALLRGREIHGFSWRMGFSSADKVNTALVDMYAKSGFVQLARVLFEQLVEKRVVSWNAMISGYAMHGHADEALALFDKLRKEAILLPDNITFVGVLSACSRAGLLHEGRRFFDSMLQDFSIKPTVQHYTCMIDLLGHAGRLAEAHQLIKEMPMKPDSGVWGALLNGCKIHGDIELGEKALRELIELEPDDAGNYVILSNIYCQTRNWEEAAKIRKRMTDRGLKKTVACSWIEVKNKDHAFLVGDLSHPQSKEIYGELEILEGLMQQAGYVPDTMPVFHNVSDDEKRNMVRSHSERLAIAFGLISTPPGTKLMVKKNIRVCEDCHVAIKFISQIVNREIIIRDVNRYHHFKGGHCSCLDYW